MLDLIGSCLLTGPYFNILGRSLGFLLSFVLKIEIKKNSFLNSSDLKYCFFNFTTLAESPSLTIYYNCVTT